MALVSGAVVSGARVLEAMELEPTEMEMVSVALALVAMELEHTEVVPDLAVLVSEVLDSAVLVSVALALVAATEPWNAEMGTVSAVLVLAAVEPEVGSAMASEAEMASEMVSGLADLRQSRCWLLLVVPAQAWEGQA